MTESKSPEMKVWCVQWRTKDLDGQETEGWCATWRNMEPSENALSDKTSCGHTIVLRIGSAKRVPTCKRCRALILKREKRRESGSRIR